MQNNLKNVGDYYDSFAKNQLKTGVNVRHYYILKKLLKLGLKRNHNILEIGCGIGTLTGLLGRFNKHSKILAVDISSENINIARQRLKKFPNINFIVSDMQDFSSTEKFDFIVLADVMEHIPVDLHKKLFQTIYNCMTDNAIIFINVPHPQKIEYLRKYFPEKLQIIDQSIYAEELIIAAASNGLILKEYLSYPLYDKQEDYVSVVFVKKRERIFQSVSNINIIWKKMLLRVSVFKTLY